MNIALLFTTLNHAQLSFIRAQRSSVGFQTLTQRVMCRDGVTFHFMCLADRLRLIGMEFAMIIRLEQPIDDLSDPRFQIRIRT